MTRPIERTTSTRARCAIEAPDLDWAVVYGISANPRARWSNPDAARIGYRPTQNAEDWAAQLAGTGSAADDPAARFHGGLLCAIEWTRRQRAAGRRRRRT